jgi:hypothetical protein
MVRMRGEGESHITYSLDKIRLACYNAEEEREKMVIQHQKNKKTSSITIMV